MQEADFDIETCICQLAGVELHVASVSVLMRLDLL